MSLTAEEKLIKVENELHQLALEYEKMGKQVSKKTNELIHSNKLLQDEVEERKKIESEIVEITLEEQRRFGSQLHDGLCQELTAILIFSKALAKKMEMNNTLELVELKKISDMLLGAVDQARNTARGLYPGELEGNSLMHSLEELTSLTSNISCSFHCPEPIFIDDNNTATHLYRIAQEAISNATKHGNVKNIDVSLTQKGEYITLSIKDDGIGMDSEFTKSKGIGLKIMKYRAHIMNASFKIRPNSPRGLILECTFKKVAAKKKIS